MIIVEIQNGPSLGNQASAYNSCFHSLHEQRYGDMKLTGVVSVFFRRRHLAKCKQTTLCKCNAIKRARVGYQ